MEIITRLFRFDLAHKQVAEVIEKETVHFRTGEDGIQKIKEGFPYFDILSKERRESTTPDWHAEFFY